MTKAGKWLAGLTAGAVLVSEICTLEFGGGREYTN